MRNPAPYFYGMKQGIIYTLVVIAIAIAAFGGGWLYRGMKMPAPEIIERIDTLVVRDTIVPPAKIITRRVVDSIPYYIPVHDTVVRTIYLPRTQLVTGGEDFTAWISGFEPQLDSIKIYPEVKIVTEQIKVEVPVVKRWSIGIQAGVGVTLIDGVVKASPYIGIGGSYSLFSW